MKTTFLSLLAYLLCVGALIIPRRRTIGNDGIRLAVSPKCGPLSGSTADVNAGVDLFQIKTIVSFGVSIRF
jgi:hypothetical protein